jgi:hypothetical protein
MDKSVARVAGRRSEVRRREWEAELEVMAPRSRSASSNEHLRKRGRGRRSEKANACWEKRVAAAEIAWRHAGTNHAEKRAVAKSSQSQMGRRRDRGPAKRSLSQSRACSRKPMATLRSRSEAQGSEGKGPWSEVKRSCPLGSRSINIWTCQSCGEVSPKSRLHCPCGFWRGSQTATFDWICKQCGHSNRATSMTCVGRACPSRDWTCPGCGQENWGRRPFCNLRSCRHPRPERS